MSTASFASIYIKINNCLSPLLGQSFQMGSNLVGNIPIEIGGKMENMETAYLLWYLYCELSLNRGIKVACILSFSVLLFFLFF